MRLLSRKALRDVRSMGLRALMILLVIGAGGGTAAGIALALDNVRQTRDAFYSQQALADLDLRLRRPVDAQVLQARARQVKAQKAETRLIASGQALLAGGDQRAAELVGAERKAMLNKVALVDGSPLSAADPSGVLLEADFADEAGIDVGDELRLRVGTHRLRLHVRGIGRSPEYLLATSNPEYLLPRPGSLAVVFLQRRSLERFLGVKGKANDLVLDLPPGEKAHASRRVVAGLPVARLTPREQQYSLLFTEADVESFSTFTPVMGGVFAIVGFLLVLLSLRRLVHSQRRELGALLALGYRRATVALSVMLPAAILAVGGALLSVGVAIGVGWLVGSEYSRTVGFPAVETSLQLAPLAVGALLAAAATLFAAGLPAWRLTRLRATEAMRGDTPASFAVPRWLERATAGNRPALTYAARTLLRRPLLTATTVVSIAAAIGLGAAMNVVLTSSDDAVKATFTNQRWTDSVELTRPLPKQRARALAITAGARKVETVAKGPARLSAPNGRSARIELVAVAARPPLRRLELTQGGPPSVGAITLSEQTAAKLETRPGQRLSVATSLGRTRVVVGGTARTLAGRQTYMLRSEADPLLGTERIATGMLISGPPAAAKRLRNNSAVAQVTSRAAAQADAHKLIEELTGLVDVLLAISLGVGALFLVSSLLLSFLDRQSEFATLRALGHGRRQIAAIVGGEALGQTLLASVLSVPLGLLIAWPLSERIGDAWFRIGIVSEPPDFAFVIVPALVLATLASIQAVRRVLRLDIARVVRARLVG